MAKTSWARGNELYVPPDAYPPLQVFGLDFFLDGNPF